MTASRPPTRRQEETAERRTLARAICDYVLALGHVPRVREIRPITQGSNTTIQEVIDEAVRDYAEQNGRLPGASDELDPETRELLDSVARAAPTPALRKLGLAWMRDVQRAITEAAVQAGNVARARANENHLDTELRLQEALAALDRLEMDRAEVAADLDEIVRHAAAAAEAAELRRQLARLRREMANLRGRKIPIRQEPARTRPRSFPPTRQR